MLYYDCCSYDFHSFTEAHAAFGSHSQGIPAHDYEEQGLQNHIRKSSHSEPAYYPSFNGTYYVPGTEKYMTVLPRGFCIVTWLTAGPKWTQPKVKDGVKGDEEKETTAEGGQGRLAEDASCKGRMGHTELRGNDMLSK